MRTSKVIAGFIVSLLLVVGGAFLTSAPASAATYVTVINFSDSNIKVNGKTITPSHNSGQVKRDTISIRVVRCSWVQGLNKDGSQVSNRAKLNPNINYNVDGLDDGTANQFGIFNRTC